MHRKEATVITRLIVVGFLFTSPLILLHSQTRKDVPVYPNATLNTTLEPGEEAACCSFSTTDPLDKVAAFYEAALKTKALDMPALGTKYPSMKPMLDQMKKQLPAGTKYIALVISEMGYGGAPGPVLLEILSTGGRTNFSLSEQDLGLGGAQFAHEFRKATSTMDNLDQDYENWKSSRPAAQQEQFGFPVYPGSLIAGVTVGNTIITDFASLNLQGEKCYTVDLCILDSTAFEKVVSFYTGKLKGQFEIVPVGTVAGASLEMVQKQFYWKTAGGGLEEFHGKEGDVNRRLVCEFAQKAPPLPYYDREQLGRVAGASQQCIVVTFSSVMLGTCEEFPKETRRNSGSRE
jgi:hypothetical protein